MEPSNYKIIKQFINSEEKKLIVDWIETINHKEGISNHHLSHLAKGLKGKSFIFNQSQTELTNYITQFQSISQVSKETIPDFIINIQSRIAKDFNFPLDNIFFQAVDMPSSSSIGAHYDASLKGFINYKCNISVLSEDYTFHVDKDTLLIQEGDLYGFEASLYKHWTDVFKSRRVFLSFGFIIPYELTGRLETDPRVRLSQRIEKYFQSNN